MTEPKHAVGIDLGTTHCAVASVEIATSDRDSLSLTGLGLPQVVAPGEVETRPLLPSFLYLPHPSELPPAALTLPWPGHPTDLVVGEAARALGTKVALRLVSSAKSWLCQSSIDRRAPLLPLHTTEDVTKLSPLAATVEYLNHMRNAWDHAHPDAPLSQQLLSIGVPASFDPAARELTAEAARLAGLDHAVLIEEPQAALYSWLGVSGGQWREQVKVGDVILVVDVGGGTSDFSLICVRERDGDLELERIAVGEHILLGGDNMDLALAFFLKNELEGGGQKLDNAQLATLTQASRAAKERLLNLLEEPSAPVVLPGRGSKLVGGALKTDLKRSDLEQVLLEGFFPIVDASARPASRARGALTQLGLPYAQDPAITRHLAAFLGRQASALGESHGSFVRPTAVLFNGGVFKSELLRERIRGVLDAWLSSAGAPPVRVLPGADLEAAVARGAAYYGWVRSGNGIRIRGGTAMAYYVGIESAMPAVPGLPPQLTALCIAPFGMEEGTRAAMPQAEFGLVVGEPVRFHFFGSSTRREDDAGSVLEHWNDSELSELQDIEVTLQADQQRPGDVVSVQLQAAVTEVGTLQLEAVNQASGLRWKVELDTRDAAAG
ncbi:MAG TPA: Hsp70 family protein [Polyangiales bacterium]|nr:Hsp70 family protein [Polyangiales bacterium]